MKNFIKPSELYEWTINNIHSFSIDEQGITLKNLRRLDWIPKKIESLNPAERERFKSIVIPYLEDENVSLCLMSVTCILYNLKIKGINVSLEENAINTCRRLIEQLEKQVNYAR